MASNFAVAIVAAIFFLIPSVELQASQQADKENLYVVALRTALEERAKMYSAVGHQNEFNVVIEKNDSMTRELPEILGPFQLTILDEEGMQQRFKKVGKFSFLKNLADNNER